MKIGPFRTVMEQIEQEALVGDRRVITLKSGVTLQGASWQWTKGHFGEILRLGETFIDIDEIAAVALVKTPESALAETDDGAGEGGDED